jgi:hypothetical protein
MSWAPAAGTSIAVCAPVRDVWALTTGPGQAFSIGCPDWDYRFHNWSVHGAAIQFWAVCVDRQ